MTATDNATGEFLSWRFYFYRENSNEAKKRSETGFDQEHKPE